MTVSWRSLLPAGLAAGASLAALAAALLLPGGERGGFPQAALQCASMPAPEGPYPNMVWVPGGDFLMGEDRGYPEEGPVHRRELAGFWMDRHEVTNRQFADFVAATGYRTSAERLPEDPRLAALQGSPGSAVFTPLLDGEMKSPFEGWWRFLPGADWRHPEGPGSDLEGRWDHPVVHVSHEDARAYAQWAGRQLPSEEQFEYAARSSARKDAEGLYRSNTWQGLFPFQNEPVDGFTGTAPAGCYPPNDLGLYDMIGNVWEWTDTPYLPSHDFAAPREYPDGYDPARPGEKVAVIKGGSYLCAPNYCMRYRPEARQGQGKDLGTSHIGFRTVLNP